MRSYVGIRTVLLRQQSCIMQGVQPPVPDIMRSRPNWQPGTVSIWSIRICHYWQILINLPFLLAGFLVKWLFFIRKGMGREYAAGVAEGFKLSASAKGRSQKVHFAPVKAHDIYTGPMRVMVQYDPHASKIKLYFYRK